VADAPKILPFTPRHVRPPRASSSARGYGSTHRRLRDRLKDKFPLCQWCHDAWSTDLHHADGDTSNLSPANLVMLCESCHHGKAHGRRGPGS